MRDFVYNTNRVLSGEEIVIAKKDKKGLLKTTNFKNSVKSYEFRDNSLFIVLKTGQKTDVPALRADILMEKIAPEIMFNIVRTRFFDENMQEL